MMGGIPLMMYPLLAVGTIVPIILGFSLLQMLAGLVFRPESAKKNKKLSLALGAWAVVTGASDGIGKEFAIQLSSLGFNVVLIARNKEKLDKVAAECVGGATQVVTFDFATADAKKWAVLASEISKLEVGILVNNVAMNSSFPTPWIEEDTVLIDSMIQVNIISLQKITRLILPQMLARKKGMVLNIGSELGKIPSGLLATYAATKAFLLSFSQGLAMEVEDLGVHVEYINLFFVATSMSKIRKASWLVPTPKDFVEAALCNAGQSWVSTPYPSHAFTDWMLDNLFPSWLVSSQSYNLHADIRTRALKKLKMQQKTE